MQGNRKDNAKSNASVRIDSAVHTYIVLRFSKLGISQTLAAKIILQDQVRAGNTIVIDTDSENQKLIAYVE